MSIDWADLNNGTSVELGKGVSLVTSNSLPNSTLERGDIDRSLAQSGTKDIEFRFKVPIDLRAITFNYTVDGHWRHSTSAKTCGVKVLTWQAQPQQSLFETSSSSSSLPFSIFRRPSLPKPVITIINQGYRVSENMRRRGFNMDPCYPLSESVKFAIAPEHQSGCLNINKLKIKLGHLSQRTRVTFSKIIILGQPTSEAFIDPSYRSITDRFLNYKPGIPKTPVKNQNRRRPFINGPTNTSRGLQMVEASTRQQEDNIPPEFFDPFTNQLMEFPMLLPSGKIIDQAFLDKYIRLEKKWSRKPNDPFTGRYFTREHIPIPATELKKRIDKWCLLSMFDTLPEWYTG